MKFNVIVFDFNSKKFIEFDIIPTLVDAYKKTRKKDRPKDLNELKSFIIQESMYRWWSKCEYEIILSDWSSESIKEKWDVHKQVMMNIDLIVDIILKKIK